MSNVTLVKSMVESYEMRFNEPEEHRRCIWAIVNLDLKNWVFSATSDCGDFSYRWCPEEHRTFKELLVQLDRDYFLNKISDRTEIDEEESIRRMKKFVIECRKDGSFEKEEAREAFNCIRDLERGDIDDDFEHYVYDHFGWDYMYMIVKTYPNSAVTFYEIVFKNLQDILRREIEDEKSREN